MSDVEKLKKEFEQDQLRYEAMKQRFEEYRKKVKSLFGSDDLDQLVKIKIRLEKRIKELEEEIDDNRHKIKRALEKYAGRRP